MVVFMNETPEQYSEKPPAQSLRDFVYIGKDEYLDIEVAVKEDGRVVVFHSHPFRNDLSWMEFDLGTNKLDFVLDGGDIRDVGMPLNAAVSKNMQNSHQILMVLLNPETGEAKEGNYVPLIIHKN